MEPKKEFEFDAQALEKAKNAKFEVIDGSRSKPLGFVDWAETEDEANKIRARKCRMGGFIRPIIKR